MSRIRLAPLLGILVLVPSVAGSAEPARCTGLEATRAAVRLETLRAGVSPHYPPIAFEEAGRIVGVEPDFARALEKETGIPVRLERLPFPELIPALREGRIDVIMSGMSAVDERSLLVRFTEPYLTVGQMLLVRKPDLARLRDPRSLDAPDVRLGADRGTTGEAWARGRVGPERTTSFASAREGIAALRDGRVDVFVHDAPTVWRTVGGFASEETELTGIYRPLTRESLAWAVRIGEGEPLGRLLDAIVSCWNRNGRIDAVLDAWIPVRKVLVEDGEEQTPGPDGRGP